MIPWGYQNWTVINNQVKVSVMGCTIAEVHSDDPRIARLIAEAPEMLRLLKAEVVQAELATADKGWDYEVNALIARVEGKKE